MRHRLPILIALAVVAAGCAPASGAAAREPASHELPATALVTLDGDPADLGAIVRGRAAVVSLWATWCDACLEETSALQRLDTQAGARGDAVVVGIAVGEPRAKVAAFAREHGLHYARLVDEEFRLADALGQPRLPATLVVDRAGRIVYRGGALDAAGLAAFRDALGEAPTR
jgi:peroxiredoxin